MQCRNSTPDEEPIFFEPYTNSAFVKRNQYVSAICNSATARIVEIPDPRAHANVTIPTSSSVGAQFAREVPHYGVWSSKYYHQNCSIIYACNQQPSEKNMRILKSLLRTVLGSATVVEFSAQNLKLLVNS